MGRGAMTPCYIVVADSCFSTASSSLCTHVAMLYSRSLRGSWSHSFRTLQALEVIQAQDQPKVVPWVLPMSHSTLNVRAQSQAKRSKARMRIAHQMVLR